MTPKWLAKLNVKQPHHTCETARNQALWQGPRHDVRVHDRVNPLAAVKIDREHNVAIGDQLPHLFQFPVSKSMILVNEQQAGQFLLTVCVKFARSVRFSEMTPRANRIFCSGIISSIEHCVIP